MWSIVAVTAAVASTVTSVHPGYDKLQQILYFPKLSTWLCSLMGVPMITESQTVPVITFIKFCFWKTNKKILFRDVFYISQNLYCLKNRIDCSDDILFLIECVDLWTIRKVLNCLTLFSIFVLSYRNLALYLNWMTEVYVCVLCVRMCLWVCIR